MPNTKFDLPVDLPQIDLKVARDGATKTLYAGAGVADLAVETLREYLADVQKKVTGVQKDVTTRVEDVQKRATKLELQPAALREQAITVVNARVDALTKEAKARRAAIEARVAELQAEAKAYPAKVQSRLVNDNVETAGDTYDELVKRGEVLVARIRRQESTQATKRAAATTTAKAKTTKTQAAKATKKTASHRQEVGEVHGQEGLRQEVRSEEVGEGHRHRREEDRRVGRPGDHRRGRQDRRLTSPLRPRTDAPPSSEAPGGMSRGGLGTSGGR